MNRYSLGAEELVELGRPLPLHREGPGNPMLVELGSSRRAVPMADHRPFFAGRPRLAGAAPAPTMSVGQAVTGPGPGGIVAAALIAAAAFGIAITKG